MNRRLIIRVLGAILLVEAAAMIPALLVPWFTMMGTQPFWGLVS